MKLRKCPSCHDRVGAESPTCPRCGVNFRTAYVRRVLMWLTFVVLLALALNHYVFHLRLPD